MELSVENEDLLLLVLHYWDKKWDCESPTLFGVQQQELKAVIANWPDGLRTLDIKSARAIHNGLGEILYGASALHKHQYINILGQDKLHVESCFTEIGNELKLCADE